MEGEQSVVMAETSGFFAKWGNRLFVTFAFLLPIFFIPSQIVNFQFGKGFFLYMAVFSITIIFLMNVLKEGKVSIPKSWTVFGLVLVFLAYIVSGIFSPYPATSLLGHGFEIDTAIFMFVALLTTLLVPFAFKQKSTLFNVYLGAALSFGIVFLFNLIRVFFPGALSFGIFNNSVSNLVGTWNDLGIFAGFVTLLSLISLGVLESKGLWRAILHVSLWLGVITLAVVNFGALWFIIGAFSLIFFLYSVSYAKYRGGAETAISGRMRQVSFAQLVVLFIAIIFLSGSSIGNSISSFLNIQQLEARPSFTTTMSMLRSTLSESPVLGIGPNRFVQEWLHKKPAEVNESIFWAVDFNAGIGTIPTSFITVGGIGILAWIIFFVMFLFEGIRAIRRLHGDAFAHYLAFSSFVGAIYFWVVAFSYTPTHAMYTFAFIFTGIFVATLVLEQIIKEKNFDFADHPGKSFAGSLVTIVLIIVMASSMFITVKRFASFAVFNRAIAVYGVDQNLDQVQARVANAATLDQNDIFLRTLSDIYLARMSAVLQQPDPGTDEGTAALQDEFRSHLTNAIIGAQTAINTDPDNYQNWLQLAKVYESIVPLNIQDSYEEAKKAYAEVERLNPKNPALPLALARLESAKGDNDAAREYIAKAFALKSNYTDAAYLLAQIEVAEGNTKKATEAVSAAALLSPTNPVIFFQLGLLQYNDRQWANAAASFERAVQLEPQYANAKYFLGLSYERIGQDERAIAMFEDLASANPDNQEVGFILKNLKDGKSPFAEAAAANIDDEPEKRDTLPVDEE